jgi:hypothetical protein
MSQGLRVLVLQVFKSVLAGTLQESVLMQRRALGVGEWVSAVKAELLAQIGWRGKLNDRVISPAFRTLEDPHCTPLTPTAVFTGDP